MQDLTNDPQTGKKAYLVPSSMQAGNTTYGDPGLAMTAPGSLSVLPVPEKPDVLPMPRFSEDGQIPVSHPGNRDKVKTSNGPEGGGRWSDAHPNASLWKEV